MNKEDSIKKAKEAFDYAVEQAKIHGQEMLDAVDLAEKTGATEDKDIFIRRAKRAAVAYENWRGSAELAANVLRDLHQQPPD